MSEPIEECYFNWLCAKVVNKLDAPQTPSVTYWKLLRVLHTTEFIWTVPNDDNRMEDGLELRTYFLRETGLTREKHWSAEGCSILEMLIAFAYRVEFQTDVSYVDWFWIFLENLGLIEHNDANFRPGPVANILERFIWRTYTPSGLGGLFPLEYPHRDQRDVEIWYQFCEYLVEHE